MLESVLVMAPMPLAGVFCESAEEAARAPTFPLTWLHCSACGLIQVREDVSGALLYSKYNYASSTIAGAVRHFATFAEFLVDRYGDHGVRFLEIGCNDGVLLTQLPRDWRLVGCDPSDVALAATVGRMTAAPYELINASFDIEAVRASGVEGSIDVITGSNCLAHISDLKSVFDAAWLALRPAGHFWIEVHDLDALLQKNQWDTIYHEHKAEWSEASLVRCLQRVGFRHLVTFRTPTHGGSLRIGFEKTRNASPPLDESLSPPVQCAELRTAYELRYETDSARTLRQLADAGKAIGAYGAAGRANVYLNQLRDLRFRYVVDDSPLRMGKFLPRIATPVVAADSLRAQPIDACLVTAWNYYDDIVRKNPGHGGAWLTAF